LIDNDDDEAIDMLSSPDSDGVGGWGLNELKGLKELTGLRGPGEPNGEHVK